MGFMDDIEKLAGDFSGGGSTQQAADAASDHVQNMDSNELAGHLTQSLPNMNQSSLAGLGQQLLSTFASHPASTVDATTATQEAGVSQEAVAAGEPGAVGALISYAKANPQVLQAAASAFMQRNPAALEQLAPGLLQGIMGRFGGAAS
jgi:hypothetical protein